MKSSTTTGKFFYRLCSSIEISYGTFTTLTILRTRSTTTCRPQCIRYTRPHFKTHSKADDKFLRYIAWPLQSKYSVFISLFRFLDEIF